MRIMLVCHNSRQLNYRQLVLARVLVYTDLRDVVLKYPKTQNAMKETKREEQSIKKSCDGCGGSGQISFFRGVSRFVMDWDDCPDCLGTGYIEIDAENKKGPRITPAKE